MTRHWSWGIAAFPVLGVLVLSTACSSPPSRLYLLSAQPPGGQEEAAMPPGLAAAGAGSSTPPVSARAHASPVVAVSVSVPEYLDRLDILKRTSANEVKPDYSAQWGENLSVTAARALAENLERMTPSDDILMLPSRSRRNFDYIVNLDLSRFESDAQGRSVLEGRWSISEHDGTELASGRARRADQAAGPGYDAMAAAMSRNLAAVSADIAQALRRLPAASRSRGAELHPHLSANSAGR
ncbi:MAG TPA: PqiC family protein [Stellaceae bacterium]|nr:PqiC family protein [Stellaceae bacterium]